MIATDDVVQDVISALAWAEALRGPFNSAHEGYWAIAEELSELRDEVKKRNQNKMLMRSEAVRVAAMAIKFIKTVCDK